MKIAFQGEIGAFSEEAVRACFPEAEVLPKVSFEAVFEAVAGGEVDKAVIPIENSLFGSVHVNYDLLQAHTLSITGELSLRIRHHLMALPDVSAGEVKQVFSHPQALGQCQEYLRRNLPHAEPMPVYDTAGAAKMVAENQMRGVAAIASERAATEYGLQVLAAGIESNPNNYTRFLILSRNNGTELVQGLERKGYKTSIVYSIDNVPGALFRSLAVFALRDLDLYKIESRPLVGYPGSYLFYLDFAGSVEDEAPRRALDHLGEMAEVKVLGSYPKGEVVDSSPAT